MSFTPKGVIPVVAMGDFDYGVESETADWALTKSTYGYGFDDITKLMEQSTFGMGALPTAWSGQNLPKERNLYGRDIDTGNNYAKSGKSIEEDMEANKDRYYFPFAEASRAHSLREAYSSQKRGLETRFDGAVQPYDKYASENPYKANASYEINYGSTKGWVNFEVSSRYTNYKYDSLTPGASYPYALVFKDPKYWRLGWSESYPPTSSDLVPNDSRMYQTKLVLWRLLQNEDLFKGIRFGLATTFLNPVNTMPNLPQVAWGADSNMSPHVTGADAVRADLVTIFRVPPYGSNIHTQRMFDLDKGKEPAKGYWTYHISGWPTKTPPILQKGQNYKTLRYANGILLPNLTGHAYNWGGMHAQFFPMWGNEHVGLNYNPAPGTGKLFDAWSPKKKSAYKFVNRASLHVPIADYNYKWEKVLGNTTRSISQLDKFRLWIDGLGDIKGSTDVNSEIRNSQFHHYKNPEIGIAGAYALPGAIFQDPRPGMGLSRADYISDGGVWYSHHTNNVNFKKTLSIGQMDPRAFYNAGSGEASGSVIDFFSPTANSYYVPLDDLGDVSFPIRCPGDDNWLIVIASGMEVKPSNKNAYSYYSWDAVKNLYDYTDKKNPNHLKVTTMRYKRSPSDPSKSVRTYSEVGLDRPIRTLVVGVVGNPEDPEIKKDPFLRAQVEEMRENLNRMARAGQGVDPYDKSSDIKAYFADDVPSLLDAVNEALLFINDSVTEQAGKGSVPVSPSMDGDKDALSTYLYSYRIMRTNQWEGFLTRYEAKRGVDGNLALTPKWELGRKIRSARGNRNLRYWDSSSGFVRLTAGDSHFRDLIGMDANRMDSGGIGAGAFTKKEPHDAMYEWMQGYDYSYSEDKTFDRSGMLSDMGQSGVVFSGAPEPIDSLPGYLNWANSMGNNPQPPMLYAQTNDGVLHAVNPSTGEETMAILPPPTLVPSRLATLKTSLFQGKLRWIDVTEPEGKGKLRSNAAYVLDGPLQAHRFDMSGNGTGWGTFLLGTTGRAGNGLYMMDITRRDSPRFMWYREKTGGQLAMMDANQREPVFEDSSSLAAPLAPYMKLGFNAPKPAMGVTGQLTPYQDTRNIVVVPGGVMTDVDLSKNGGEGAVLLVVDPEDGSIIKAFDSDSLANGPSEWRSGGGVTGVAPYMGMMTSEPTLYRSDINPYLTGKIFAADNRGNIFRVSLEEDGGSGVVPIPVNRWRAETIATLQQNSSSGVSDASYSIPHGVAAIKDSDDIWLAGGTDDIVARANGSLPDGALANKSQMIFAFRTNKAQQSTLTRDDMKELDRSNASSLAKNDNKEGWYLPLSVEARGKFREYVSAKPTFAGGILFISTFIQKEIDPDAMDICRAVRTLYGDSRLYALDVRTGAPSLWVDQKGNSRMKYVTMSGIKVTGMTQTRIGDKDILLLTVDKLSGEFDPALTGQKGLRTVNGTGSLVEVELPSGGGSVGMNKGESVILYWITK
ncbi:MAG: hypothetical protein LBQ58_07660, partial [Synergistaceae bacterium]|jgi:hypothetical protein|nr:hypothetical protein [Synergistaceae bacterium]